MFLKNTHTTPLPWTTKGLCQSEGFASSGSCPKQTITGKRGNGWCMLRGPVSGLAGSTGSVSQASLCIPALDSGRLSPSEKGRKDGCWQLVTQQRDGLLAHPHTDACADPDLCCWANDCVQNMELCDWSSVGHMSSCVARSRWVGVVVIGHFE